MRGIASIQNDLEILLVVEVFYKRRIGKNRLQGLGQREGAGSFAGPFLDVAEKALQDIVGALGLDEHLTLGGMHGDGIGKELFPIHVNLLNHLLVFVFS